MKKLVTEHVSFALLMGVIVALMAALLTIAKMGDEIRTQKDYNERLEQELQQVVLEKMEQASTIITLKNRLGQVEQKGYVILANVHQLFTVNFSGLKNEQMKDFDMFIRENNMHNATNEELFNVYLDWVHDKTKDK